MGRRIPTWFYPIAAAGTVLGVAGLAPDQGARTLAPAGWGAMQSARAFAEPSPTHSAAVATAPTATADPVLAQTAAAMDRSRPASGGLTIAAPIPAAAAVAPEPPSGADPDDGQSRQVRVIAIDRPAETPAAPAAPTSGDGSGTVQTGHAAPRAAAQAPVPSEPAKAAAAVPPAPAPVVSSGNGAVPASPVATPAKPLPAAASPQPRRVAEPVAPTASPRAAREPATTGSIQRTERLKPEKAARDRKRDARRLAVAKRARIAAANSARREQRRRQQAGRHYPVGNPYYVGRPMGPAYGWLYDDD